METEVTAVEPVISVAEPIIDEVMAAEQQLETAVDSAARATAALGDAESLIAHAESALRDERKRLDQQSEEFTEALLARRPLPSATASRVEAIEDAIGTAKSKRTDAKADADRARREVVDAQRALLTAREAQMISRIAAMLSAQPQLVDLARALPEGEHTIGGFRFKREQAVRGMADLTGRWQPSRASTFTITIELEPIPN